MCFDYTHGFLALRLSVKFLHDDFRLRTSVIFVYRHLGIIFALQKVRLQRRRNIRKRYVYFSI